MRDKGYGAYMKPETESELPIGIYAGFGFSTPFADRMAMIHDAGFSATSIWWEERNEQRRRLRHLAPEVVRKAGLLLENIHVPYYNCADLWSPDPDKRRDAVELHARWIKDCIRHDIPMMVMHVALGPATPPPSALGVESLQRLVDVATDGDVTIAIENTRYEGYVNFLLEEIASPHLGLCYDSSHDHLYSDNSGQLLARWGDRLVATHFSDTDGRRDQHWLPGDGVIDFEELSAAFPSHYAGSYMLEVTTREENEGLPVFLNRARDRIVDVAKTFTQHERIQT